MLRATAVAAVLAATTSIAPAKEVTISGWSGGSGPNDNYREDAIEIAADFLEREAAIRGEELNITIEKTPYSGWDDFKQALTLSAEAGKAPNHRRSAPERLAGGIRLELRIAPIGELLADIR